MKIIKEFDYVHQRIIFILSSLNIASFLNLKRREIVANVVDRAKVTYALETRREKGSQRLNFK